MSRAKRIVIVGGGVIGLCCALYARRRGHEVTLIERGGPEHDSCSLGNAGMIVPSHFTPLAAPGAVAQGLRWMLNPRSPFYVRPRLDTDLFSWSWKFARASNAAHVARSAPLLRDLSLASRALFEELAAELPGDFSLVQRGLLMLCRTEHALAEEAKVAARANELGVPAEVVTPTRVAELDPAVRMSIAGGVYFPRDAHLTPQRFVAALTAALHAAGVAFCWETEIAGWRSEGRHVQAAVTSDGQEIAADEFVLAGGAWSPAVVRGLGLRLPMQPGKGYSLTLPAPRQLPRLCSIFCEARVAVTPMGRALRVGGTMELSGFDAAVRAERVAQIVAAVPEYFPEFRTEDFRDVPVWHGFRPCSPDGMPYIGRFAGFANLTAATGHAMMGLSLGPITGRLVAEILSGEKTSVAIETLNPDRYR